MKIYLVGMPGSGKSTLGKQLAEELNLPFIDLDAEIEKSQGRSIPEVFREKGEDHFRQVESQLLREWSASQHGFVMATGGGAPCFYNGMEVINNSGISVYLNVALDELLRRTEKSNDRPLLGTNDRAEKQKRLHELLNARDKIYSQAKIKIAAPTIEKLKKELRLTR
jgi:shikimate kinase